MQHRFRFVDGIKCERRSKRCDQLGRRQHLCMRHTVMIRTERNQVFDSVLPAELARFDVVNMDEMLEAADSASVAVTFFRRFSAITEAGTRRALASGSDDLASAPLASARHRAINLMVLETRGLASELLSADCASEDQALVVRIARASVRPAIVVAASVRAKAPLRCCPRRHRSRDPAVFACYRNARHSMVAPGIVAADESRNSVSARIDRCGAAAPASAKVCHGRFWRH